MNSLVNHWLTPAIGAPMARHDAWRVLRARAFLAASRTRLWLLLLALLMMAGLLLAFERIVQEGVQRGDLRRLAVAAHADAMWRCNIISSRARREGCHALLSAGTTAAEGHPGKSQTLPAQPPRR